MNWTVANILARLICVIKNHTDYHVVSVVVYIIKVPHVDFHVVSCSMEIHMVNYVVG